MFIHHLNTSSSPITSRSNSTSPSSVDALFIIDRKADLVTPLLTQLTYEGLLDEVIGVKNSHVEIPGTLLAPPPQQDQPNGASGSAPATTTGSEKLKKHRLSSSTDPLLGNIRDLNFSNIGRYLQKTARRLDTDFKVCSSSFLDGG